MRTKEILINLVAADQAITEHERVKVLDDLKDLFSSISFSNG